MQTLSTLIPPPSRAMADMPLHPHSGRVVARQAICCVYALQSDA